MGTLAAGGRTEAAGGARRESGVLQMTCSSMAKPPSTASAEVRELGDADLPAMRSLTARVYPWYFRARTPVMGRYVGVFDDDRLVAMGGERFRLEHACELSGICTDAAYVGRGYAGAIVRRLVESLLASDVVPFLHLSTENTAHGRSTGRWDSWNAPSSR